MATILFTAQSPNNQNYNQDGDSELNVRVEQGAEGDKTLDITNTNLSGGPLTLNETVAQGLESTQYINIGSNVDLHLGFVSSSDGSDTSSEFNFNLSDEASFTMGPSAFNLGATNIINIDMGQTGTSTFKFDSAGGEMDPSSFPTIFNITDGDQIIVTGSTQYEYTNGDLIFRDADNHITGQFNADGLDPEKIIFEGGTMVYACFLKGTKIATPEGESAVELLAAGDKVIAANGKVVTVKWIGHRTLYKNRIPERDAVRAFPVLFKKDAIADNVPHADLVVSPGHHLKFGTALVPAMLLVNGQTIIQQFELRKFEYFHVELEEFNIILAEGVPAESYVDMGNRSMFQNAKEVAMNPNFGPAKCRPVIDGIVTAREGPIVEAIRQQLLVRAEQLTGAIRTDDAALCIEVNGQIVQVAPPSPKDGVYRFKLPKNAGDIRIISRSSIVRDVTPLARRDIRNIGVGLSDIAYIDNNGRHQINMLDSRISGMYPPQDVNGSAMRWTNGSAMIPGAMIQAAGQAMLELTVLRTHTYWRDIDSTQALARTARHR